MRICRELRLKFTEYLPSVMESSLLSWKFYDIIFIAFMRQIALFGADYKQVPHLRREKT